MLTKLKSFRGMVTVHSLVSIISYSLQGYKKGNLPYTQEKTNVAEFLSVGNRKSFKIYRKEILKQYHNTETRVKQDSVED